MTFSKASARELQIVDPVLSQIARNYRPSGFLYPRLFPTIDVEVDSGQYPVFDEAYWFGDDIDNKVSDRADTPEIDFSWSLDQYLCEDYRLKVSITRKERKQAHGALRLERNKTEYLLSRMAMRRERRGAAMLRNTANGGLLTGGVATPAIKWDAAGATIEADILAGKLGIRNKIGMLPNAIVFDYEVACRIAMNASVRDLLKYTVDGRIILSGGEAVLPAKLWGLSVIVAGDGSMVNTAKEGAAKALSAIYGDSVRILYIAPGGGGWGIPSTSYSFKSLPEEVDKWTERDPPVDYVRAWESVDEKVCAPEAGYEISDVLTG